MDLLEFTVPEKRISFSASFGISNLPEQYSEKLKKALKDYKSISVREDAGKKIIEDVVGRKDVEVLVDPTMLLTADEWDKVAKKPEQLKTDRYILNYFLGKLSEKRKEEIDRIAKENNCEVINILDQNSPFYCTGPSEFLYLGRKSCEKEKYNIWCYYCCSGRIVNCLIRSEYYITYEMFQSNK